LCEQRIARRARFVHALTFVAVVEADQQLTLLHFLIRVDEHLIDAFRYLTRDRILIRIDLRVVRRLVRKREQEKFDAVDQRN
jgi:hypothetical protein